MKILHIVPTYLPAYNRGGPIWSVHNLNKELVKKGIDVTVYTTNIDVEGKVEEGKEVIVDGVKVWYFPASFPRIWEYWRVGIIPAFFPRHWEYSRDLHKALIRNTKNFDIIHVTSTFLFASALGPWYAKKHDIPSVLSPRGNLMEPLELKGARKKKAYIHLIEKRSLAKFSAIHFTVPQEKEQYLHHELPLKKAVIIPNSIEVGEFKDRPQKGEFRNKIRLPKEAELILFIGRLNWKKGFDTLIPAFRRVAKKNPRARLVIAGGDDEGYRRNIQLLISNFQLEDKVIFTGMITGADKIAVLQDCDVFVLSSYSENFSMAAVEAMHFGLPVVLTKRVGVAPDVKKAGAGFVVEKDEKKVAQAMINILEDKDRKNKMGKAGRNLVEEKFEVSSTTDKWIEIYKDLLCEER